MRKVEATTVIKVAPEIVIRAFTEPDLLNGWWGVERSLIEKRPGGAYTLAWKITEEGFGYVSSGTIRTYNPDREISVENMVYLNPERPILGLMTLTVRASVGGEGSEVYIRQDGYQSGPDWDWYYQAVVEAWPAALKTLKDYLEGL